MHSYRINPDIRPAVYCGGIRNGDDALFDAFFGYFNDEFDKNRYYYTEYLAQLQGLACTRNPVKLDL